MQDDDKEFEAFFDAARRTAPQPSADLVARILAEAEAAQPKAAPTPERPPWWRSLLEGLGGAPAIGGLLTATVAGLWIGAAQPFELEPLTYVPWGVTDLTDDTFGGYADLSLVDG
ncbi:MAG: dihydroorotate dehydrogenase [Pseudomonadota bacterium]